MTIPPQTYESPTAKRRRAEKSREFAEWCDAVAANLIDAVDVHDAGKRMFATADHARHAAERLEREAAEQEGQPA